MVVHILAGQSKLCLRIVAGILLAELLDGLGVEYI